MTKGNITKILFQFAAPLVASSLLQQLYNIADSMIAGNFIGENAVAAIGVSTSIVMFFTNCHYRLYHRSLHLYRPTDRPQG